MSTKKNSFFLFGGSFLNKLKPQLKHYGDVVGEMLGISPLSEYHCSDEKTEAQLTDWLEELDCRMQEADADYFVLDLQRTEALLFCSGGRYISTTPKNETVMKRKEIALVDPTMLPSDRHEQRIDRLAEIIRKHFSGDHIILIHTHHPVFWLAGNNLRVNQTFVYSAAKKKWMDAFEQRFRENSNCRFIDVTKFYFYYKEPGKPLTNVIFEPYCYEDVALRIHDILNGEDGSAVRPEFALSLKRYAAYKFTLQKKPFPMFLDQEYFLDKLILSASAEFVNKYFDELVALDVLDWSNRKKSLKSISVLTVSDTLKQIIYALDAVLCKKYHEPDIQYGLMFRNGIVPDEMMTGLKKYAEKHFDILPVQITQYNAGYYYALMQHMDPTDFVNEDTVIRPVIVDEFGSCVSRTAFNVQDNDFVVNHYWFHVPPFEKRNPEIACDPELFPEKLSWTDRLVKKQFEKKIYQDIIDSEAEWFVIDLYSLISPNTYCYKDSVYSDFDQRISKELKAKKIAIWRTPNILGDVDDILNQMADWIELVKKKFGEKIILIDAHRLDYWIGDDNQIYRLKKKNDCNAFAARAFEYVQKALGCYAISISKEFLPDELGFMRNTPSHKEDICYFATHDIIKRIVTEQPEEKIYDKCPGEVWMKHWLHLSSDNSLEKLKKVFSLSEVDEAVLRLDPGLQKVYQKELAEIYDLHMDSLQDVIESYDFSQCEELKYALNRPLAEVIPMNFKEIKTDYPAYSKKSGIASGTSGLCKFPKFAKIKVKKIWNDKNVIRIQWESPENKAISVRIYRKSENEDWELVGTDDTGSFEDNLISANTDYTYSLCAPVEWNEHVLLGGFTRPVHIRSCVAVPHLLHAVCIEGINTLTWKEVPGAEGYRIYYKKTGKDKWIDWEEQENVGFRQPSRSTRGGEWYTVRAYSFINGKKVLSDFERGISAKPL